MLGLHLTGRFSPRFFLPANCRNRAPVPAPGQVGIECLRTIYPIEGKSTPVSPGNVIEYEVPDMYGRPWEEGMEQPEDDDIFSFE